MKRRIFVIISVLAAVTLCLLLASCGTKYSVRFYALDENGNVIYDKTEKVAKGSEFTVPEITPPEGYRLSGWLLNDEICDFEKENAKMTDSDKEFAASFEKKEEEYLQIDYENDKTGKKVISIPITGLHDTGTLYENDHYYVVHETSGKAETSWRVLEGTLYPNKWGRDPIVVDFKKLNAKYGVQLLDDAHNWAPDIFKYNGKYYLIGTYWCDIEGHDAFSERTHDGKILYGHHATAIYECDTPMGNYKMISKLCMSCDTVLENSGDQLGHLTLGGKETIDATLFVDKDGQPWLVYCDEHSNYTDGGRVSCAKLSDDLTHLISEPFTMFKANADGYNYVTDSPFIYQCENGDLLCLWSAFKKGVDHEYAYCVIVSRNKTGKLDSKNWKFDYALYDGSTSGLSDDKHYGGHENIIMNSEGELFLTLHIYYPEKGGKYASYIPIYEKNNKLVWGYNPNNKIVNKLDKENNVQITKMSEGPYESCSVGFTTQMDSDIFCGLRVETDKGWAGIKFNWESQSVIIENSDGKSTKYNAYLGYTKRVKIGIENLVGDGEMKISTCGEYSEELSKALAEILGDAQVKSLSFYSTYENGEGNGVVSSCTGYTVKGIRP